MLVRRHRLVIAGVITAAAIAVPTAAFGVRIRFVARQARGSAGVCRQRLQVQGRATRRHQVRGAVPAGRAGRVCGHQPGPAAGRTCRREAGRGQHPCGHRGFRRIGRGVASDRPADCAGGVRNPDVRNQGRPGHDRAAAFRRRSPRARRQHQRGPARAQSARRAGREGGVDPASPAFAAIARGLGVSPAQLAAALDAVKQSLAGQ